MTPDLLPSDVTGVMVFDQRTSSFSFRQGPVFTNVLIGDEINRASPKTQSALLEVMEERQVTADGVPHLVPRPFFVIATQNPRDFHGTFPLPDVQLDRFAMRHAARLPRPRGSMVDAAPRAVPCGTAPRTEKPAGRGQRGGQGHGGQLARRGRRGPDELHGYIAAVWLDATRQLPEHVRDSASRRAAAWP